MYLLWREIGFMSVSWSHLEQLGGREGILTGRLVSRVVTSLGRGAFSTWKGWD